MRSKINKIVYLKAEDLLLIHTAVIDETGGRDGVRDLNRIAIAVSHPQQIVFGNEIRSDIFLKAAAYGFDIMRYHPFVDGNKRTAMTVMGVFLELNGVILLTKKGLIEKAAVSSVEDKLSVEDIAKWLKKYSKYK